MNHKKEKNKDYLANWVPPNSLIHQIKVKKELLSLGNKAKWFCITRWLNLQINENITIHIKNFKSIRPAQTIYPPHDKLEFPDLAILKMYFKISPDIDIKEFKLGFVNKKQNKIYPRIGVKIPNNVFIKYLFPKNKNNPPIRKDLQKKVIKRLKMLDILNYFPNRDENYDQQNANLLRSQNIQNIPSSSGIISNDIQVPKYILLTEKNWSIISKEIDTDNLTEYISENPNIYYTNNTYGYYTAEYIAKINRKTDKEINEPDICITNDIERIIK